MVAHATTGTLGRQGQVHFWDGGQPGLQSEFQDSQGYTEKPCLKKTKQNKTKQKNPTICNSSSRGSDTLSGLWAHQQKTDPQI